MHLVVGLGNPGARHRGTRHNVGFIVIDCLSARWNISLTEATDRADAGVGRVGGMPVALAKPRTFMNASGDAVAALHRLYEPASLIVVFDDLDLALGRVRIRNGGGSGGHRGVASVITAVGSEFVRVRIGIGRPPASVAPVEYVLDPFSTEELDSLDAAIAHAADGIETLLRDGLDVAMRTCNGADPV